MSRILNSLLKQRLASSKLNQLKQGTHLQPDQSRNRFGVFYFQAKTFWLAEAKMIHRVYNYMDSANIASYGGLSATGMQQKLICVLHLIHFVLVCRSLFWICEIFFFFFHIGWKDEHACWLLRLWGFYKCIIICINKCEQLLYLVSN